MKIAPPKSTCHLRLSKLKSPHSFLHHEGGEEKNIGQVGEVRGDDAVRDTIIWHKCVNCVDL